VTADMIKSSRGRGHRVHAGIRHPMQTHGEASPCGHPTDTGDRWRHWLEINLA